MIQSISPKWKQWLAEANPNTAVGEYIGAFPYPTAHFPDMIFQTNKDYRPSLMPQQQFYLPIEVSSFLVGGTSMRLMQRTPPAACEGED
jgi:hypothetical protein